MDIEQLLNNPEEILKKKPFLRGSCMEDINLSIANLPVFVGTNLTATLPKRRGVEVTQDQFLLEIDPMSHKVHFDKNVPDIAVQDAGGKGYYYQKNPRIAFPFQKRIVEKRTQHLCGKPIKFTLCSHNPSQTQLDAFIELKEEWINKNMDVWKRKLAKSQMSVGDGALLAYFNTKKALKFRLLSYVDGYVLLPHYDDNGEMILFGVYYKTSEGYERLDVYDDTNMHTYKQREADQRRTWELSESTPHGFDTIPIAYIREEPAFNSVQSIIDIYEILYNIYAVVMKKFGNSIMYIKGNYDSRAKKAGWAIILNAPGSMNQDADAKVLSPAEPKGMQNLLTELQKQIQLGSSSLFLHPGDITISGDISGIAVKLLLSAPLEKALEEASFYDDVADKLLSLFTYGVGIEKKEPNRYGNILVRAEFDPWMPQNDSEMINNINMSVQANSLSGKTAREINPLSAPDEENRFSSQEESENAKIALEAQVTTSKKQTAINEEVVTQ